MRVAISDACGSYFGNANLEGQVRVYEIDEDDYRFIREVSDDGPEIADQIRKRGREVTEQRWSGETIPV